jgi:hypothetical protein
MPSPAFDFYIEQHRQFARARKGPAGNGALRHWKALASIARRLNCRSALDYGCGKGLQFRNTVHTDDGTTTFAGALGCKVTGYDPAIKEFSGEPRALFDLVYCIDVLAAVPPDDVRWVADRLYSFAEKALFVAVCTFDVGRRFPNGESQDLTIRPERWWREQFTFAPKSRPVEIHLLIG